MSEKQSMKVLYISYRINASDGSSVHGRAFVDSVANLGHQVETFPEMRPIEYVTARRKPANKPLWHYLKKFNFRTLKYYLGKTHGYVAEFIDFADGVKDSVSQFLDLRRRLKADMPDVIVCRQEIFHFAPIWAAGIFRIPCLLEVNSIRSIESPLADKKSRVSFITRWAEHWAIGNSDGVFSVSRPIKDYVDRYTDPARSRVIPNGVDTAQFDPEKYDRDLVKKELGLDGKTVLGYVGSYKTWHGLDVAVDVIERLGREDPKYHLLLIGNGQTFRAIASEVLRRGLSDRVTQLPYLAHEDVARHLAVFDYALMTYPDMEGFYFSPLKMFEYLSMEIPVIATNVGQIGEIIRNGETGMLVHPPTAENFAHAVAEVDSNPVLRIAMRENCRALVLAQYGWDENARQVMNMCQELIQAKNAKFANNDSRRA
jgi:glycosyltransferase involved in cell wall biosynthesis